MICLFGGLVIPGQPAAESKFGAESYIFVEPGDSYLKLFGYDWYRVYSANDEGGSPDRLVTGKILKIPEGTYLTEFARKRIASFMKCKNEAEETINQVEYLARDIVSQSDAYFAGLALLERAKVVLGAASYGFSNYNDAKRIADEARILLNHAVEIKFCNHPPAPTGSSAEVIQPIRPKVARIIGIFIAIGIFVLALTTLMFLMIVRRNRIRRDVMLWLGDHSRRISRLSYIISELVEGDAEMKSRLLPQGR